MIEVFGSRGGKHGHDEPILDDDDWASVDKASAKFDERFAEWVRPEAAESKAKAKR